MVDSPAGPEPAVGPEARRPAAMCLGAGHLVVYGNRAFVAAFGTAALGIPAREGLIGLPGDALALLDTVFDRHRPLARWIHWGGDEWRLTVAPREDAETGETYGVSFHLRARADVPIRPSERAAG